MAIFINLMDGIAVFILQINMVPSIALHKYMNLIWSDHCKKKKKEAISNTNKSFHPVCDFPDTYRPVLKTTPSSHWERRLGEGEPLSCNKV